VKSLYYLLVFGAIWSVALGIYKARREGKSGYELANTVLKRLLYIALFGLVVYILSMLD